MPSKKQFNLPPAAQAAFGVLFEEGKKIAGKALAAAVGSGTSDARKIVRQVDDYLKGVEGRAGEVAKREDGK